MEYYLVGTIIATHGIKGELKVKIETSFPEERFKKGSKLFFKSDHSYQEVIVSSYRTHKQMALITINHLENINDVLTFVGKDLYVDRSLQNDLQEDDFYYNEIIGLTVYNEDGHILGSVSDIMEVPQGEILIISKMDGKEALVPFVDEYIKKIDLEKGIIIISPIEGLL
jgi:16S rRNA processing protein RimM